MLLQSHIAYRVCFISRYRLSNSYGIVLLDGEKRRIESPDVGLPSVFCHAGEPVPVEYLQAINQYEKQKHQAMDWSEPLIGEKPKFKPRFADVGYSAEPVLSISPYGTFI